MTEEYVTKEQDNIQKQKISGKEVDTQITLKSSTPRHNVIKMQKRKKGKRSKMHIEEYP